MARTQLDPTLIPSATQNIRNILINGGMEIWQRAVTFTNPATLTYVADRWKVRTSQASTVIVTRDATILDSGIYSFKAVLTGATGGQDWRIEQQIENPLEYKGKTVTLTARVRSNTTNSNRIAIYDGVDTTFSSYHSGGSTFETLTVTKTLSGSATELWALVGMLANGDKLNGTYYYDSIMLTISALPVSFVPPDPQQEFARCQRYYEKSYDADINPGANTALGIVYIPMAGASTSVVQYGSLQFKVPKRVTPTMTGYTEGGVSGSWTVRTNGANLGDGTFATDNISTTGLRVRVTAIAGSPITASASSNWYMAYGHFVADAEI